MTNTGFNEADHSRIADGTFTTKDQTRPEVAVTPDVPKYVAPDAPALQKTVRYRGAVSTWGGVLESINAVSVERSLIGDAARPTWYAVKSEDPEAIVKIPASVARASGLPDSTDPVDRINDDLTVLSNRREKLIDPAFGPRDDEAIRELRTKVDALVAEREAILRDRERPGLEGLTAMEKIQLIDGPSLSGAQVQVLTEDDQPIYVVRVVAGSPHRTKGGRPTQRKLLSHPDETVRSNFITGNDSLMDEALFEVFESDSSKWVRDAASAELDRRGRTVVRISPTEVRWGWKQAS